MRIVAILFAMFGLLFAGARTAEAVTVSVDLSSQTVRVQSARGDSYVWGISSARSGFVTPRGAYKPYSLQRMHYSKKYHNSPMPHSIFFKGGYAIHGTSSISELGRPASHGCIRLAPQNAAKLFAMVQQEGANITISGSPPLGKTMFAKAHKKSKTHFAKAKGKPHKTMMAGKAKPAHPLAYAPTPRAPTLKTWLNNPLTRY
jgi:hypothetical protein